MPTVILGSQAKNYVLTSSSSTYTTDQTTYQDVNNLEGTIICSGKTPIYITLVPNAAQICYLEGERTASDNNTFFVRLRKDGTDNMGEIKFANTHGGSTSAYSWYGPGAVSFIDETPTAGSHTYRLQAKCDGADDLYIYHAKMLIMEL